MARIITAVSNPPNGFPVIHELDPNADLVKDYIARDTDLGTKIAAVSTMDAAAAAYKAPTDPLAVWKRARNLAQAGALGRNARILIKGDSKTMGAGIGGVNSGGGNTIGANALNKPRQFAVALRRYGFNVTTNYFSGFRGLSNVADYMAYDTKLTNIGTWTGGGRHLGGAAFYASTDTLGTYTPDEAVNRVSLLYRDLANRPNMTVSRGNSDAAQIIVPAKPAISVLARTDLSFATLDSSAINFGRVTGSTGNAVIMGLIAWNSNKPGIEIIVDAVFGITTTTASEYDAAGTTDKSLVLNCVRTYAPDLTIINLGTNDFAATPLTTTIANMTLIIDSGLATGSVIVIFPTAAGVVGGSSGGTDAQRALAKAAYKKLAADKGCLFLDEDAYIGGRAVTGSYGAQFFRDTLHENAAGQYHLAEPLARVVAA